MIWFFILFPLIGSILAFRMKTKVFDLSLLMLFSGAYLLTVTLTGILPEAVSTDQSFWMYVGAGYVLQLLFDVFTRGVEHGHVHDEKKINVAVLFIALFFHAFLEGMPLALLGSNSSTLNNYFVGLALHEIPAAFVLAYLLSQQKTSKRTNYVLVTLYAAAVPIGFSTAHYLKQLSWYTDSLKYITLALCSGILLHIATTVISENFKHHSFNKKKWLAFGLGLLVAAISLFSHQLL